MLIPAVLIAVAAQTAPSQPAAAPAKPFDCSAPEYRQFDFWVGEWDVSWNPEARPPGPVAAPGPAKPQPGLNIISKIHGGCVILETWDDRTGGTGQSFNIFDRVTRQWHQTWVDNTGGLHKYWGGLKDGIMVYLGDIPLGPGARFQGRRTIRVSFVPMGPDKMRQLSESLNSDGTWTMNYDLIYNRRPVK